MQHDDQFITIEAGGSVSRRIACNVSTGQGPVGIFWMCGFLANMRGRKASALAEWCGRKDYTLTRFDYSGRGHSEGRIEDGTISQWLEETKTVFIEKTTGPQIVIGSSMGGWLALLLMRALAPHDNRIAGCILVAPAWNMTEALMWDRFPPDIREEIDKKGAYDHPSAYGPYTITKQLIKDGRSHLIHPKDLTFNCPVAVLHGMQDRVVPWQRSLEIVEQANHDDMVLELIRDGDHGLSRDRDLARLFRRVDEMVDMSSSR